MYTSLLGPLLWVGVGMCPPADPHCIEDTFSPPGLYEPFGYVPTVGTSPEERESASEEELFLVEQTPVSGFTNKEKAALKVFAEALSKEIGTERALSVVNHPRFGLYRDMYVFKEKTKAEVERTKQQYRLVVESHLSEAVSYAERYRKEIIEAACLGHKKMDPYLIPAIVNIETNFGKTIGMHLVPNTLFTKWMFGGPRGKKSALKQLAAFVRLSENHGWDGFQMRGSWAGAFGLGQFMPGTLIDHYQDGDGDGKHNPLSDKDAIATIARFWKWIPRLSPKKRPTDVVWCKKNGGIDCEKLLQYNNWKFYVELGLETRNRIRQKHTEKHPVLACAFAT